MTQMRCPCGGRAYSLADMKQMCREEYGDEHAAEWGNYWESLLAPDDYYCSAEDDVLLPGEAKVA